VWFLPVTFLAGIHGFIYFVPYLLFVATVAGIWAWFKRVEPVVARVHIASTSLELEASSA
jgi:hypothetical protein